MKMEACAVAQILQEL